MMIEFPLTVSIHSRYFHSEIDRDFLHVSVLSSLLFGKCRISQILAFIILQYCFISASIIGTRLHLFTALSCVFMAVYIMFLKWTCVDEPSKVDEIKLPMEESFTGNVQEGCCSVKHDVTIAMCVTQTLNDRFEMRAERTLCLTRDAMPFSMILFGRECREFHEIHQFHSSLGTVQWQTAGVDPS